jgi:Ca-activated chloride channel family protein
MPFPFVFIFPAEGTFWMDNPFCILETDWVSDEQREVAELYRDYLLEPAQQDLAVTIGLRPATAAVALHAPIALEYGTDPRVSPQSVLPLKAVSGETQAAILDLFQQTKKKATVTILIDISASMSGAKLKNAMDGTIEFMNRLAKDDEIYIFLFNEKTIKLDPGGRAGDVVERLGMTLRKYDASSNTALYDSICEAVYYTSELKTHSELAGEKRLYGVVVLSDGMDTYSGIKLTGLLSSCLPTGEDVEGIKVYTIAYGSDADQKVLKQIAEQTNGKFLIGDPKNIQAIYLALSAEQ